MACEFVLKEAGTFVIVPSTSEPGQELDFGINVYSDEPVELAPVSEWLATEASGEWKGRSAGGCRNSKAWVANPMYALRVQPGAAGGSGPAGSVVCHAFLSQQPQPQRSASAAGTPKSARSRGGGGAAANDDEEDDSAEAAARALSAAEARAREKAKEVEFEGIGFYLLPAPDERDGGAELGHFSAGAGGGLGLVTSGFYSSEEVGKEFTLELGERYLLMPSTYRKGVQGPFQLQLFSEAPLELRRLKPNEQAKLTEGPYRTYAAEILQKARAAAQPRTTPRLQRGCAAARAAMRRLLLARVRMLSGLRRARAVEWAFCSLLAEDTRPQPTARLARPIIDRPYHGCLASCARPAAAAGVGALPDPQEPQTAGPHQGARARAHLVLQAVPRLGRGLQGPQLCD